MGHESQVPAAGDHHTSLIGDQEVIMVRAAHEQVHVLYNRCPHKGAKVVQEGSWGAAFLGSLAPIQPARANPSSSTAASTRSTGRRSTRRCARAAPNGW